MASVPGTPGAAGAAQAAAGTLVDTGQKIIDQIPGANAKVAAFEAQTHFPLGASLAAGFGGLLALRSKWGFWGGAALGAWAATQKPTTTTDASPKTPVPLKPAPAPTRAPATHAPTAPTHVLPGPAPTAARPTPPPVPTTVVPGTPGAAAAAQATPAVRTALPTTGVPATLLVMGK